MARFFIHLRDGTHEILDEEGREFSSLDALRKAVMLSARDLISGDVERGVVDFRFRIDAENEDGELIYSLPFKHAVSIIPETHESAVGANDA